MIQYYNNIDDLPLPNCYPDCETCRGFWMNEILNHRIVCICCKSNHKGKLPDRTQNAETASAKTF